MCKNEILVILVCFRQRRHGRKVEKTVQIAILWKVFGCQSSENTAKISVLDRLYGQKRVNYQKHCKNTVKKSMFWKDIFHICLSWLAAVKHGKIIEENTVNSSSIFEGFGPTLWPRTCKLQCFFRETL